MWQGGGAVHPDGATSSKSKGVAFVSSKDASLSPTALSPTRGQYPSVFALRAAPPVEIDKDPIFAPEHDGSDKALFQWESDPKLSPRSETSLWESTKEMWRTKTLPKPIPLDSWWFEKWTWLCVAAALLTGWVAPFLMAFEGLPETEGVEWTVVQWTLVVIFVVDVLTRFVLEYEDPDTGMRVQEYKKIALFYAKNMLGYDVVFLIPWSTVVSSALGLRDSENNTALLLGLLRLLQLGRMYRFSAFIAMLEYRMILPQTAIVVLRNNLYVLGSSHVAGCMFFLIARLKHFQGDTWVGRHAERFDGIGLFGKYAYSLYFALAAFTGLGDNDFYIASVPEACIMGLYLLFNMLMAAYILGTVTMLMVKGDKRMKQFRDRVTNLREYGKLNSVPPRLMAAMEAHTELHFHNDSASDEQVLSIYPQTIRRRVLRHLYMEAVQSCYLFKGCNAKYLDLVLSLGRAEQFMPSEQLVAEGDMVNEVFIILEGEAEVTTGGQMPATLANMIGGDTGGKNKTVTRALSTAALKRAKTSARSKQLSNAGFDDSSTHMSSKRRSLLAGSELEVGESSAVSLASVQSRHASRTSRTSRSSNFDIGALLDTIARQQTGKMDNTILHAGRCFGQTSFFSDTPSHCSVWSKTIIKVLVISKSVYQELLKTYPQQTRKVLDNMEEEAEEDVRQQILGSIAGQKNLNKELVQALHDLALGDKRPSDLPASIMMEIHSKLDASQRVQLDNLSKVKDALGHYVKKVDQEIVYQFLNHCTDGDEAAVRAALAAGMSPNAVDYDKRTGLILGCLQGHEGVVRMLLEAGADPQLADHTGRTPLQECVRLGRDDLVEILLAYGASLNTASGDDDCMQAAQMCEHIRSGNLNQLERLLRAGANADMCDYNDMTPLHVACVCSNLAAVQLLVTQGQVELGCKNVWGRTALEEAQRLGDKSIIDFLEPLTTGAVKVEQQIVKDLEFLTACKQGRLNQVQAALKAGQSPDTTDPSQRTALMFACSSGHANVAKLLLHEGADPNLMDMQGHSAMWECVYSNHPALVDLLLEYGGTLGSPDMELAALWGQNLAENQLQRLLLMLRAGADPEVDDYQGSKPLHVAAMLGNMLGVRLLIEEANAVSDAIDGFGRTAVECARAAQAIKDDPSFHDEVISYLDPIIDAATKGQIRNRLNPAAPPAVLLVKDMGLLRVKDMIKADAVRRFSTLSNTSTPGGTFTSDLLVLAPSSDADNLILKLPKAASVRKQHSVELPEADFSPPLRAGMMPKKQQGVEQPTPDSVFMLPSKSISRKGSAEMLEINTTQLIQAYQSQQGGAPTLSPHPATAALAPPPTGVASILRTGSLPRRSSVATSAEPFTEGGPQPLLPKASSMSRGHRASFSLPHSRGVSPTAQLLLDQVDKELNGIVDLGGAKGSFRMPRTASFKMPPVAGGAGPSAGQPPLGKPLDAHVSTALLKRARRASVKMDHNAAFMHRLMSGSNDPMAMTDEALAEYQQLIEMVGGPPRVPSSVGHPVQLPAEQPTAQEAGPSKADAAGPSVSAQTSTPGDGSSSEPGSAEGDEFKAIGNPTFEHDASGSGAGV